MATDQAQSEAKKFSEMIQDVRVAMLTTSTDDGALHSRPMATPHAAFDGNLWFFTDEDTAKCHEIQANRRVNVSYADPADNLYVSVSGEAEVIRDKDKARQLWSPLYQAWFPDGLDDPKLALLKVHVERADYWDPQAGKMIPLKSLS